MRRFFGKLAILLSVSLVLLAQAPPSLAAPGPTVRVAPALTQMPAAGGALAVTVTIENATNVYGFQLELGYNRTAVNATQASLGPFLSSDGWTQIFTSVMEIDNAQGVVAIAASRYGVSTGVSGAGVLVSIDFSVAPQGTSVLDLRQVKMGDSSAQTLGDGNGDGLVDSVFDGFVNTRPGNIPPFARMSYSPGRPLVGQLVGFDAASSYDLDGSVVSHAWQFGDGSNATGVTTTHTYPVSGRFNVTLTVGDDQGGQGTASSEILVSDHDLAVTRLTTIPIVAARGDNVTISFTVSNRGAIPETFDHTAYYNGSLVSRYTASPLAAGASRDLSIVWSTGSVPPGRYVVSVNVTVLADEVDASNNLLQTITIIKRPSSLSLSLESSEAQIGVPARLGGTLIPARQGTVLNVFLREGSSDWALLANVSSDASGYYSMDWTPTRPGLYDFQAYWSGDIDYIDARSSTLPITVSGRETFSTAFFLIIAAPIGGVLSYLLIRRPRWARSLFHSWKRKLKRA